MSGSNERKDRSILKYNTRWNEPQQRNKTWKYKKILLLLEDRRRRLASPWWSDRSVLGKTKYCSRDASAWSVTLWNHSFTCTSGARAVSLRFASPGKVRAFRYGASCKSAINVTIPCDVTTPTSFRVIVVIQSILGHVLDLVASNGGWAAHSNTRSNTLFFYLNGIKMTFFSQALSRNERWSTQ